jgi:hypothetical protein
MSRRTKRNTNKQKNKDKNEPVKEQKQNATKKYNAQNPSKPQSINLLYYN